MKRFCYEFTVRKTFEVYADNDAEATERALQEEITANDLEITFKERLQPEPTDR